MNKFNCTYILVTIAIICFTLGCGVSDSEIKGTVDASLKATLTAEAPTPTPTPTALVYTEADVMKALNMAKDACRKGIPLFFSSNSRKRVSSDHALFQPQNDAMQMWLDFVESWNSTYYINDEDRWIVMTTNRAQYAIGGENYEYNHATYTYSGLIYGAVFYICLL